MRERERVKFIFISLPHRELELPLFSNAFGAEECEVVSMCNAHLHSFSKNSISKILEKYDFNLIYQDSFISKNSLESAKNLSNFFKLTFFNNRIFSIKNMFQLLILFAKYRIARFFDFGLNKNDDRCEMFLVFQRVKI